MLWQVLSDKQCGQIRTETYCKIYIRVNCCGMRPDALGSYHIKMLFRSSSSLLNRILYFVQWCPSNLTRFIRRNHSVASHIPHTQHSNSSGDRDSLPTS